MKGIVSNGWQRASPRCKKEALDTKETFFSICCSGLRRSSPPLPQAVCLEQEHSRAIEHDGHNAASHTDVQSAK